MGELNIRELRKKYGMSQQKFADATGISKDSIGNWERNKGKPKVEDYAKLESFIREREVKVPQQNMERNLDVSNLLAGGTEYLLIPKSVIQEKYRLVAVEQIEKDKAQIEKDRAQIEKEKVQLEIEKQRIMNDGIKDKSYLDMMADLTKTYTNSITILMPKNGNANPIVP